MSTEPKLYLQESIGARSIHPQPTSRISESTPVEYLIQEPRFSSSESNSLERSRVTSRQKCGRISNKCALNVD